MIPYIEKLRDPTKNYSNWYTNSVNSQDTKIDVHKSVAFLYTNNEAAEREIKELIPFTIAPKTIHLRIHLTKEV